MIRYNRDSVELTGEPHILGRRKDLESCLNGGIFIKLYGEYQNLPIERIAGLLLYRVAQGQFFLNGNKRTTLLACLNFLGKNGFGLSFTKDEIVQLILGFAGKQSTEDDSIDFIKKNIKIRG